MTTDIDEALRLARECIDEKLSPGEAIYFGKKIATALLAVAAENEQLRARGLDLQGLTESSPLELHADNVRLRAELARWEALGERHDIQPRPPGCRCDREPGDSACPVHGGECEAP